MNAFWMRLWRERTRFARYLNRCVELALRHAKELAVESKTKTSCSGSHRWCHSLNNGVLRRKTRWAVRSAQRMSVSDRGRETTYSTHLAVDAAVLAHASAIAGAEWSCPQGVPVSTWKAHNDTGTGHAAQTAKLRLRTVSDTGIARADASATAWVGIAAGTG